MSALQPGDAVVYDPGHGRPEDGVVVRISPFGAFVRYADSPTPKLTPLRDLTALVAKETP